MPLRSVAPTISAMAGNDMLNRADALLRDLKIPFRWAQDARQEAILAQFEGRDPTRAIRLFLRAERAGGMTGWAHGDRPTVVAYETREHEAPTHDAETMNLRRAEQERRADIAGAILVQLSEREQLIVRLRAMEWTQAEIATHLGVSQPAITKALQRIAAKAQSNGS